MFGCIHGELTSYTIHMITLITPIKQHCNHDELDDDDEVLQPKLSIGLANFNTACMLQHASTSLD